jgi:hypothetical protein
LDFKPIGPCKYANDDEQCARGSERIEKKEGEEDVGSLVPFAHPNDYTRSHMALGDFLSLICTAIRHALRMLSELRKQVKKELYKPTGL